MGHVPNATLVALKVRLGSMADAGSFSEAQRRIIWSRQRNPIIILYPDCRTLANKKMVN
jgi:hypothetical protein